MKIIKKDVLKLKIEFYKLNGWVKIKISFHRQRLKKLIII